MEDRADGVGVAQTLHKLVADIAYLEIREDEHVGVAGDLAARRLLLAHTRNESCVGLQLAVDLQRRVKLLGQGCCLDHLVAHLMLCTAFRRERKHGHARVGKASHRACGLRRAYGNLCQLSGIRHRSDGHVANHENAVLTVLRGLGDHQHGATYAGDARRALDNLEGRTQRVAGCAERTGYLSVGIAALDDEASEIEGVEHLLLSLLQSHALLLPQFEEQLGIFFAFLTRGRVNQRSLVDVLQSELVGQCVDLVDIAEQDEVGKVIGQRLVSCGECTLLRCFREDDALLVAFCARNNFVNQVHNYASILSE